MTELEARVAALEAAMREHLETIAKTFGLVAAGQPQIHSNVMDGLRPLAERLALGEDKKAAQAIRAAVRRDGR